MSEQDIIKEREKKILDFINKKNLWIVGVLIIALILGIYIRSLPMQDHGGNPGLWDISTNSWTLGPDLDPWLFVRTAEMIVNNGSIPETDMMRSVPLGQDTTNETMLLPYMIAWTYKFLNIFMNDVTIELAGDVFPVIMFALTILTFFFMVKEIFEKSGKRKAEIIAGLSTFFMIVILHLYREQLREFLKKNLRAFVYFWLIFYSLNLGNPTN
jgi:asparagine N-glycosylation enzyme membrane subunit Stt3